MKATFALLFSLCAAPLAAQDATPFRQHDPAGPVEARVTAPVEVPLLLLGRGTSTLPVVEIFINGKGPFRFGIETGAQFVGIRPGLADSLNLPALERAEPTLPRHHADSIRIGTAQFVSVPVTSIRTAATDIDGFLGFPFWKDLLVTIDYPAQRFRMERGALPTPDGAETLPLVPLNGGDFIGIPARVGDRQLDIIIDTRSTGGFGFTPTSAALVQFDGELREIGRAAGAAIPETIVRGGSLSHDLRFGRHTVAKPFASVRALPPHFPTEPIMGTQVLRNFSISLDMANARIRFQRAATGPIVLAQPQPRPSASGIGEYAGVWGDRTITVENGALLLQRPGGPQLQLVPLERDVFGIERVPEARLEFRRDAAGQLIELRVRTPGGTWDLVTRRKG